jgi:D-arabinose 1-dehydrogenase-like Zn-dependent alcohol dehydrogenase
VKSAVMRANNAPLELEEIEIDDPGPGEVLVKTAASGICHSDLTAIEGGLPVPPPCVLGHEPAGIVEVSRSSRAGPKEPSRDSARGAGIRSSSSRTCRRSPRRFSARNARW